MTVSTTTRATLVRPVLAGMTLAAAVLLLLANGGSRANAAVGDAGFLGTAESYAVLAYSTVTNDGALTLVDGNLGVSPGTAVTGFGLTQVTGSTDLGATSPAGLAMSDATAAYVTTAGLPATGTFPSGEVGGSAPVPGVYTNAMQLTGALTLDGDADDVWVFQSGSTLTTAAGSSVILLGNANPCNVYWQVGSSATLGTGTSFVGTILAQASISLNTAASVQGRLLAQTGAVTLLDNVITLPQCTDAADDDQATGDGTTDGGTTTPGTPATDGSAGGGTTTDAGTPTGGGSTTGGTAQLNTTASATTLPATGSDASPFLLGGALLAVLGTGLLIAGRRRPSTGA
jgi:LPXTG-motif cell wall-anchored protein